jgi:pyruvate kinase
LRKTKIICTIGPSSIEADILEQLMLGGMDIARINTSHSSREDTVNKIKLVRSIAKKHNLNTAIMLDLQGPKIRVGKLEDDILLDDGQDIIFSVSEPDNGKNSKDLFLEPQISQGKSLPGKGKSGGKNPDNLVMVNVEYKQFLEDIREGCRIFIDDGLIELTVISIDKKTGIAKAKVIRGGTLKSKKGINLPGITVSVNSITEKDLEFLDLGIENNVDFVAQSFVRNSQDIRQIKDVISKHRSHIMVIAKIEKHEAVADFDNILKYSDGIMIARGDLGIEIPEEDVPNIQKDIIRKSNLAGKPVITATQMLDSMIRNPRPTRAEVSDVANAIFDGSDALMLSGETAAGAFPVRSLQMMVRIINRAEENLDYSEILRKKFTQKQHSITEAISFAACEMANVLGASAIITATQSGSTARQVSKNRPSCMIIGASSHEYVIRQLMLSWGVIPVRTEFTQNVDSMLNETVEVSKKAGYIKEGEKVIITGGILSSRPGSTNFINIREIE